MGNSDELEANSIVIDRALIDKEAALAESKAECEGREDLVPRTRVHVEELESEIQQQQRIHLQAKTRRFATPACWAGLLVLRLCCHCAW